MPMNVPDDCRSVTGSQFSEQTGYATITMSNGKSYRKEFSAMLDPQEVASYRYGMPRQTWWRWSSRCGMLRLSSASNCLRCLPIISRGDPQSNLSLASLASAPLPNRMPARNQNLCHKGPGHTPTATFGYYSGSPTLGNTALSLVVAAPKAVR